MTRPTKVQREILELMADGDLEYSCYDYPYAICVGEHRHLAQRTFDVLERNGWIAQYTHPNEAVYWHLTDAGRTAMGWT